MTNPACPSQSIVVFRPGGRARMLAMLSVEVVQPKFLMRGQNQAAVLKCQSPVATTDAPPG
jgi:hypothetical protein